METIRNYLNNLFANLPNTEQIIRLKNDMLISMEEKYIELKEDGKTENEAIGIVISEFGNIDEILEELNIVQNVKIPTDTASLLELKTEEAEAYLYDKKSSGILIALGVFLCILAPASFLFLETLHEKGILKISESFVDVFTLAPIFIFVAVAVGLFVYAGMRTEPYHYLEDGFTLPSYFVDQIKKRERDFMGTYTFSLIVGIALCILSPLPILTDSDYGVVLFLMMAALGVFSFVYFGIIRESFRFLLKHSQKKYIEQKKAEQKSERIIGIAASIIWPIVTCVFLISGLIFNMWSHNWILWPITGILFGMFCGVVSSIYGHQE